MRQEFEMTQEEMDNIIAINKGGGDPVMFLSGGTPMGSSLQEKINQYWEILGNKYGFKPITVEGSSKGKLFFIAKPVPVVGRIEQLVCKHVEKLMQGDEYKVIMAGNIMVAQGYECSKCKVIRAYNQPTCNCY